MKIKINVRHTLLLILIFFLIGIFTFSLFKNIQYPLMWGDEAETAIYAERILKHGLPVVHDENNALVDFKAIKDWSPVDVKHDIYRGNTWGQYYFAALGQYFAGQTKNIYQKTMYMRIPFALAGMLGVLILPLSTLFLFKEDKNKKMLYIVGYLFLVLFLISLVLHFREVRSYSLAVLFSSIIVFVFTRTFFAKAIPRWLYIVLMTLVLFLLSNSFPPAYLAIVVSIGLYIVIDYYLSEIYKKSISKVEILRIFFKKNFYLLLPFLISVVVMIPIFIFFNMGDTSSKAYLNIGYNFQLYRRYLTLVIGFLILNNYLILGIFQKLVSIILFYVLKRKANVEEEERRHIINVLRVSVFLTYVLVIHIFLVPLTPFLFDRYYIFLQPLLALIIILDLFLNLEIISRVYSSEQKANSNLGYLYLVSLFFIVSMVLKFDTIKGHVYELKNRYVGPIDMIIAFINTYYKNPQDLVIDTNLEESTYIYYLKSQVMCDEIIRCKKDDPDIIIVRMYMMSGKDFQYKTDKAVASGQYTKILLPIVDYPTNNIPEFTLSLRHLFKTPTTDNNDEKVWLLIKK